MKSQYDIRKWFCQPDDLLIISGPCSVETREQLLSTARELSKIPQINVLRGGIWKPRTRPTPFEGIGEEGLKWMREAKEETGLLTMTEVAMPEHVEAALKNKIDIIWIGARTVVNPFSVAELAKSLQGCDIPVFVKNPLAPDVKLWLGAIERVAAAGIKYLGAIHRGFQDYNAAPYRNNPLWEIPVELHRLYPNIPIITDISHICGCRELLQETAQKALDLATDGFMIESHITPETALTDSQQQITPSDLKIMLDSLVIRSKSVDSNEQILKELRSQIDNIDDEILLLLSKRMNISEQIGVYKKEHNITVLQIDRWKTILSEHLLRGENLGLSQNLVETIFEVIHKDSIDRQL